MVHEPYAWLFLFLPAAWLGHVLVARLGSRRASLGWIVLCCVGLYGAASPANLAWLGASAAVNYMLARGIGRAAGKDKGGKRVSTALLLAGIAGNLLFLSYFKYTNFLLDSAGGVLGFRPPLLEIALPLGASFVTFRMIAFLADVRAGKADFDACAYLAFVFFLPQLSSGPITHYKEVMPQFDKAGFRVAGRDLLVGASLLAIGLFKKTVLADGADAPVAAVFSAAQHGQALGLEAAWLGALAFDFQIYFDFSGYSDIALGLARLFGVRLPMNFNSPFKSSNMIDFWARWHVSLSRFFTTYVYMPVMMRMTSARTQQGKTMMKGKTLRIGAFVAVVMTPTLLTMMLSGIWHGARATFVLWGALHGLYLCINQAWRSWRPKWDIAAYDRVMRPLGFVLTFGAVLVAIVVFRADSVGTAGRVLGAMLGLDGLASPDALAGRLPAFGGLLGVLGIPATSGFGGGLSAAWLLVTSMFVIVAALPNTQELLRDYAPALDFAPKKPAKTSDGETPRLAAWARLQAIRLRPNAASVAFVAAIFVLGSIGVARTARFIYWQF